MRERFGQLVEAVSGKSASGSILAGCLGADGIVVQFASQGWVESVGHFVLPSV